MSGEINKSVLLAMMTNQDKAAAYDSAVRTIRQFFKEQVDKNNIYEIEEDDIDEMAKDLAGALFLPDEDEVDGYFMC